MASTSEVVPAEDDEEMDRSCVLATQVDDDDWQDARSEEGAESACSSPHSPLVAYSLLDLPTGLQEKTLELPEGGRDSPRFPAALGGSGSPLAFGPTTFPMNEEAGPTGIQRSTRCQERTSRRYHGPLTRFPNQSFCKATSKVRDPNQTQLAT